MWLLTCLPLTLERLYRLRYLNRGLHSVRTAIDLRKWTHPHAALAKAFSPSKIIPLSYRAPSIRNLNGRVKSGQRWSGQNRPTDVARDSRCFTLSFAY